MFVILDELCRVGAFRLRKKGKSWRFRRPLISILLESPALGQLIYGSPSSGGEAPRAGEEKKKTEC